MDANTAKSAKVRDANIGLSSSIVFRIFHVECLATELDEPREQNRVKFVFIKELHPLESIGHRDYCSSHARAQAVAQKAKLQLNACEADSNACFVKNSLAPSAKACCDSEASVSLLNTINGA